MADSYIATQLFSYPLWFGVMQRAIKINVLVSGHEKPLAIDSCLKYWKE